MGPIQGSQASYSNISKGQEYYRRDSLHPTHEAMHQIRQIYGALRSNNPSICTQSNGCSSTQNLITHLEENITYIVTKKIDRGEIGKGWMNDQKQKERYSLTEQSRACFTELRSIPNSHSGARSGPYDQPL